MMVYVTVHPLALEMAHPVGTTGRSGGGKRLLVYEWMSMRITAKKLTIR